MLMQSLYLPDCHQQAGDSRTAARLCERSLKIRVMKFGLNHLHCAESLMQLARIHLQMGDYRQAEVQAQPSTTFRDATHICVWIIAVFVAFVLCHCDCSVYFPVYSLHVCSLHGSDCVVDTCVAGTVQAGLQRACG